MIDLDRYGYTITDLVLTEGQCEHIASSLPEVSPRHGGVRNLIDHPTVVRLLGAERLGRYLWSATGRELVAVKATLFDKTAEANWRVQWHQDWMIAVRERLDVPGYGRWTRKEGLLHVEAPAAVLAQMIAIRVHLDECGPDQGPLRVIAGSHRAGKLSGSDLAAAVAGHDVVELSVPRGAMLLIRPLLVHSSPPAATPQHRRVLHIELAPEESISPLQWHTALRMRRGSAMVAGRA